MQSVRVKRAGAGKPCLVVEADHVNNQSVSIPARDGITHVTRNDVVGMLRREWNYAKDVHVFVEHDDLCRRLDHLLREESQHHSSRQTGRKTQRCWVVDAASVEGFQYFLRSPWLI